MKNLRLALLGLAAIVALLLGASFLDRAFRTDQPAVEATRTPAPPDAATPIPQTEAATAARRKIEASVAESPDYVRFFDRLRLVFPSEYDTILNGLALQATSTGKQGSVDEIMADTVVALRRADGVLAAKASDQALGQIFILQLGEMRTLAQHDVHLCVAFLYGASGTGFLTFAADHRALIADAAIAGLDAMNSGRMDQIQRSTPSDGDFQALDKALTEKGLSRPEIEALLDGKSADPPIADERMCVAGQTYLETLASLAPPVRARLYGLAVDILAKS
ncbi:hypothetical protein [Beijerinckia sp. L45]|uniref:hypothetical protein n=1 Tax=Beijerinckia sp. L45 TaxID=1641855 RepID=UPI00131D3689|nr:hypothetical protein [Beijerinckia sp. L45]